jgi:Asp/Glu/hydantoin racemase
VYYHNALKKIRQIETETQERIKAFTAADLADPMLKRIKDRLQAYCLGLTTAREVLELEHELERISSTPPN